MKYVQASLLIPIAEDDAYGGRYHAVAKWQMLQDRLTREFGGWTLAPGLYEGQYIDPDSGEIITDTSRKYILALPLKPKSLKTLKLLLKEVARDFGQKLIYLEVKGNVYFISREY